MTLQFFKVSNSEAQYVEYSEERKNQMRKQIRFR